MDDTKIILITGGLGYIGSHTVIELYNKEYLSLNNIKNHYKAVIVDDCSTCPQEVLPTLEKMVGESIPFYKCSILDKNELEKPFLDYKIYAVIHFAGKKSVEESLVDPLKYYNNNFIGTYNLIDLCIKYKVNNFIFSSSCTVYGNREDSPDENDLMLFPINPYGRSKLFIEFMLKDICHAYNNFRPVLLRYCNPVAAHPSGEIGEDPFQKPTNLFPVMQNLVRGTIKEMIIFGKDYPTKDGTCIRDYIHVTDIAQGHIIALNLFELQNKRLFEDKNYKIYNMGTNIGYSVKEVVETYEKANGIKLNYKYGERRKGDAVKAVPNCSLIQKELGWKPQIGLAQMCKDSYNYIKRHISILKEN